MKILYFDCFAGISGDMTVGALLELGVPLDLLREQLRLLSLPLSSYLLDHSKTIRQGISAGQFTVRVEEHQPPRHYDDIAAMIESSSLPESTKDKAQRIFYRLAEAEAKVHGVAINRVHFHEVGGVDSIVDIVGTAICLNHLGIEEIHASTLPYGHGWVEAAHGRLPVPAPATVELLRGIPVHDDIGPGERVTPTGAAILAALAKGFGNVPKMTVSAIGYGSGTREFPDTPNLLRLVMGEKADTDSEEISVVETHIDDMNPEILGFLMEKLLAEGALDVAFAPLQMKKNRPGIRLTVLTEPDNLQRLGQLILTESTAIGLRHYPAQRMTLKRHMETRTTSLGVVTVKVIERSGLTSRITPEFEDCRRIALERSLPLLDVYRIVERETAESCD